MKVCQKCGYVDYKPKDKCPACDDKYTGWNCNPLDSATKDSCGENQCNGYITKGDINAKHNKD